MNVLNTLECFGSYSAFARGEGVFEGVKCGRFAETMLLGVV